MTRQIIINGRPSLLPELPNSPEMIEVEPDVYSVLFEGKSYLALLTRNTSSCIVEIFGHSFEVEIVDPRARRRNANASSIEGRQTITAPMPGKIVRVLVSVGEEVTTGQGIIVMEAMKMQNELKSPRVGTISSLNAREGATVTAGEVLATIE